MSPSPSFRHQQLLNDINFKLLSLIKKKGLGVVLVAPMDVFFDDENILQPDILFISNENQDIIQEDGIHGAPDMIIEVLSPTTAKFDLNEKKSVYERSGVKEYWIIDPETEIAQGYSLQNKAFVELTNEKNQIVSKLLNTSFSFYL